MADIDLRAEVLAGIDQQLEDFNGLICHPHEANQLSRLQGALLTALRHLPEIAKRHETGWNIGEDGSEWCAECAQEMPCPTLVSLAKTYAPQALAKMEVDRG